MQNSLLWECRREFWSGDKEYDDIPHGQYEAKRKYHMLWLSKLVRNSDNAAYKCCTDTLAQAAFIWQIGAFHWAFTDGKSDSPVLILWELNIVSVTMAFIDGDGKHDKARMVLDLVQTQVLLRAQQEGLAHYNPNAARYKRLREASASTLTECAFHWNNNSEG